MSESSQFCLSTAAGSSSVLLKQQPPVAVLTNFAGSSFKTIQKTWSRFYNKPKQWPKILQNSPKKWNQILPKKWVKIPPPPKKKRFYKIPKTWTKILQNFKKMNQDFTKLFKYRWNLFNFKTLIPSNFPQMNLN